MDSRRGERRAEGQGQKALKIERRGRQTRGRDDKKDGRMDRWKTGEFLWCSSFMNVSNCLCVSPLRDAFVRPDDGGLDVDGVVSHPSQLHGLLQGADHVQSVVSFCTHTQQFQLTAAADHQRGRYRARPACASLAALHRHNR